MTPASHMAGRLRRSRRLLRPHVHLARLDHRLRVAARCAQGRAGRRTGFGLVVDDRCGHALAARAGVRRAGCDLPRRGRWRAQRLLQSRSDRRLPRRDGRPGCRPCSSRRSRCSPRSRTSTARRRGARAPQHARQQRVAQRHRPRRRDRPDDRVHRDQPGRREVSVREQHHRRDLEGPRFRCWPSWVVAGVRFKPANFHAGGGFMPFGSPRRVRGAHRKCVVFGLQGFGAGRPASRARPRTRSGTLSRAIITAMAIGAVLYSLAPGS